VLGTGTEQLYFFSSNLHIQEEEEEGDYLKTCVDFLMFKNFIAQLDS
jgi:hypothetical protein